LLLLLLAGRLGFTHEWLAVGRVLGNSLAMRQEIHYALSLTRWLALEGRRTQSTEALWEDLVLVARKLRLSGIKLTLRDGSREWRHPELDDLGGVITHPVQGGRLGVLEMRTPKYRDENGAPCACPDRQCQCEADQRLYEILGDLLSEGWCKAATALQNGAPGPLLFSSARRETPAPIPTVNLATDPAP
jgi:hypothetical protein